MSMMVANGGLSNGKLEMATAVPDEVLAGQTFYAGDKDIKTGGMPNNGTWNSAVAPGDSVTVPWGCHSGAGKVTGSIVSPSVRVNSNVRAEGYSTTVSGYNHYLFLYVTGHAGSHSVSVTNGTVINNITLGTSDFDDGLYRDLGHAALIRANSKSASVTISCIVGSNHYGGSRVIAIGF